MGEALPQDFWKGEHRQTLLFYLVKLLLSLAPSLNASVH